MLPIKAIIVDDEQHCVDTLSKMLEKYFPDVKVLGGCNGVEQARELIKTSPPDLVFLDIQMPHYNGFELFSYFEKPAFDVIFTTAYESYALKAIKFNALDYLLKPFSRAELEAAIRKFREKSRPAHQPDVSLENFLQNLRATQHIYRRIALPTLNGLIFVYVNDIVRCESVSNYTRIYFIDKTSQIVSRSLKEFEYLLEEMNFYRIHHSHLINLHHMQSYTQGEGGFALMSDGMQVEVSRRRKADFLKKASQL